MNVYANKGFGTGMTRIVLPASSEEMANFYTALDEMGGEASKTHIVGVSNTALGVSDFLENVDSAFIYVAAGKIVTADKKVLLLFDFSNAESWRAKNKAK